MLFVGDLFVKTILTRSLLMRKTPLTASRPVVLAEEEVVWARRKMIMLVLDFVTRLRVLVATVLVGTWFLVVEAKWHVVASSLVL